MFNKGEQKRENVINLDDPSTSTFYYVVDSNLKKNYIGATTTWGLKTYLCDGLVENHEDD